MTSADPLAAVSRETSSRLETLLDLLRKWNKRINLVSAGTLSEAWTRHIVNSAQLYPILPQDTKTLVDLGSGAGFPGLVLAIIGVPHVHLVEADARKCEFLREAARLTATSVTIHPTRIEAAPALEADVITARALKPLDELLSCAERFHGAGAACYFHKGASWAAELDAARENWSFRPVVHASLTDPSGVILELREIERAGQNSPESDPRHHQPEGRGR